MKLLRRLMCLVDRHDFVAAKRPYLALDPINKLPTGYYIDSFKCKHCGRYFLFFNRIDELENALIKLRDCDWTITLPNRMDAVRDIARAALEGK